MAKDIAQLQRRLKRSKIAVYAVVTFIVVSTIRLLITLQRISQQEALSTLPHAQTIDTSTSLQQPSQKSSDLAVPPPEGAKRKLVLNITWDSNMDALSLNSIEGELGFIMEEETEWNAPSFDVISYDAEDQELYRRGFIVLDEFVVEEAASRDRNVKGVTSDQQYLAQNTTNNPGGLPTDDATTTTTSKKLGELSVVDYYVEIPYDSLIDHIRILPSEGSDKKSSLEVLSSQINHQQIIQQINSTTFQSYPSQQVLGASTSRHDSKPEVLAASSRRIGIIFISNNYEKSEISQFHELVIKERDKMLENAVLGRYRTYYEVTAVENYKDLGCKYWWANTEGWETVLGCYQEKCDSDGQNCRMNTDRIKKFAKQYRSDIVIVVHKTEDSSCRSSAGGSISFCSTSSSRYTINHELGHALCGLHDEYVYGGDVSGWRADDKNCTRKANCSDWGHIPPDGCYQGCTRSDRFRGGEDYLMKSTHINDFGPVATYYAMETLGRFGSPDPAYTPTPTLIPCNGWCSLGKIGSSQCSTGSCEFVDGGAFCRNHQCPYSRNCVCPTPTPTGLPCNAGCTYRRGEQCASKWCPFVDGGAFCRNRQCPEERDCICN